MLPDNPLLELVPARALATSQRIQSKIWHSHAAIEVEWCGSSKEHCSLNEAKRRKRKIIRNHFFWGQVEDQAWFRISVPKALRDGSYYLEWKEKGESTVYIDGVPYAGLDVAHHRCLIPAGCREMWIEVMALESGIWLPVPKKAITDKGCRFEEAQVCQRDELAWDVYHDFSVLLELLKDEYAQQPSLKTRFGQSIGHNSPLEDVSVLYRKLVRKVEDVIRAFESGGLPRAKKQLKATYHSLKGQSQPIQCRLTGHAHIDLVWLWTEKAAQFKAVHTFATANRLMDDYPEFRFGYSQPASYRAVSERSPKLMQQVHKRIKQGKWEAIGAAEVESDTLMPCGEALVRSLLVGQQGFIDLQGKASEVLWLPDVFGYSAALPQILKETGVKYFFTTKLHWGSVSLFPYSSFIWQGSDGTEILSHVSQGMGYNMNVQPGEIRKAATAYRQADVHDELLMACGYGDGGGGVTPEMCERARRLDDLAGTPKSSWGRIDDYFAGLEEVRDKLPAYKGELYLQYHRGVLTTHGDLKAHFRAAERALQIWEAAHCLTGKGPIDLHVWQRVIFAQFHDYIPGSSIPEVYLEALPELKAIADCALLSASKALNTRSKAACLFNPLPFKRTVKHGDHLYRLAPLSGEPLESLDSVDYNSVQAKEGQLSNGRVKASFDKGGRIRKLSVDGQAIATKGPLAQLMIYPDQPHAFEAWDIDRTTLSMGKPAPAATFVECVSSGVSGRITYLCALTEKSHAKIHYILDAASSVLQVEYEIDWKDPEHLLKVCFPTKYSGAQARFGDAFGSSLRSQQPGKVYDEAQWEVAGSRYAVISDDGEQEGLFVVTQAKYGWTARSGNLGLSLLRSATMPTSARADVERAGSEASTFSDLKKHHIRIAVGRFDPNATREELPAALAEHLYTPAISYSGKALDAGLVSINGGESLLPCWSKPEDNGSWTLRLHETLGRRGQIEVELADGWSLQRVDLSGNPLPTKVKGNRVDFAPYQLLSLRLKRE